MLRRCNPCAAYFLQVEFFKSEAEEATTALISNQHGTRDAQAQVEGLTQQLQGYAVRCQQLELEVAAAKSALTASAAAVATATHAGSSTEHAGTQAEPDAIAVSAQTDTQAAVHLSDASSQSAPAPAQSHATTQSDTPAEDLAAAVHPVSAIAVTQTEDVTGQQAVLAVAPAPVPVLSAASQTEAEVAAVAAEVQSHEATVAERDDVSQRLTLLQSEYNALEALYSTSVASHEGQVAALRTQLQATAAEYEVRLQGLIEELTAATAALSAAEGLAAVATRDTVVSHTDTTVAETRDGTPPATAGVGTSAPLAGNAPNTGEPGPAASLLAEVHTLRTELDTASVAAQAAQRRYEVEIQSLAFQLERRNEDFAHAESRLRAELDRTEQDLMQAREAVLAKARQLAEFEGELVGQQRLVELLNERVSKQAQHSAVVEQECARLQEEVGGLLNRMQAAQDRVTDASSAAASPSSPQSSEAKEMAADVSSELALAAPIIVAAAKEYANVSTTLQLQLNSLKTINELMVENLRGKKYFLETTA
jgi:chromosome segregation ATPase